MNNPVDVIASSFIGALDAGTGALVGTVAIPLLAIFALLDWYWTYLGAMASGGANMAEVLAQAVLRTCKYGICFWILVHLAPMAQQAFDTFLGFGLAASGGSIQGELSTPSTIMDVGFRASKPLHDFVDRAAGWSVMWNYFKLLPFSAAAWIIVGAFVAATINLLAVAIEFHFSILVSAVCLPLGVYPATALFAEFCIGWVAGCLIRVLVIGAILGISVPLFSLVSFTNAAQTDASLYQAVLVAITAIIFAYLSWSIPNRAANFVGRGLGLSGNTVTGAAMTTTRVVTGTYAATESVSRLRSSLLT